MRLTTTDKLLIAIVLGVIALVAVAFGVVLLQPKPAYKSEDTPEGVLYNYLFALSQQDYPRAYPLLSKSLVGYPKTQAEFEEQVQSHQYAFTMDARSLSWQVGTARVNGDTATIPLTISRFYSNSLFGSNSSTEQSPFTLRRQDGAWRIDSANYSFWLDCWENTKGCN